MFNIKRGALRLALLSAVAAGALGTVSAAGNAAVAGTSSVEVRYTGNQLELVYTGTSDANNVLIMKESSGAIRVNDSVNITPGGGCVLAPGDSKTVRCSVGIVRIRAFMDSGDDSFRTLVPFVGTVAGGSGDDVFKAGEADGAFASNITYHGNTGSDTVSYALSAHPVTASLDWATNDGRPAAGSRPADQDNLQVENLVGSSFGDTLRGGAGTNRIDAGRGRDTVRDLTTSGSGQDEINVRDGEADNLTDCGAGDFDVAVADRSGVDPVSSNCETISRP